MKWYNDTYYIGVSYGDDPSKNWCVPIQYFEYDTNNYYSKNTFVFNVNHLLEIINISIKTLWQNIKTYFASLSPPITIISNAPYMTFDNNIFSLVQDSSSLVSYTWDATNWAYDYLSSNQTLNFFMSDNLMSLFQSFPQGIIQPFTKQAVPTPTNVINPLPTPTNYNETTDIYCVNIGNYRTSNVSPNASGYPIKSKGFFGTETEYNAYVINQEYESISTLVDINNLTISLDRTGVVPYYSTSPLMMQDGTVMNSQYTSKPITVLQNIPVGGSKLSDYKNDVIFKLTENNAWREMLTGDLVKSFLISIYWIDKRGKQYNIYLAPDQCAYVRFRYRLKGSA